MQISEDPVHHHPHRSRPRLADLAVVAYAVTVVVAAGCWQRLDVDTALRAYTTAGAFLLHHESDVGTLATGMAADVVVLDHDLAAIAATEVNATHVDLTIAAGRVVYERTTATPTTPTTPTTTTTTK